MQPTPLRLSQALWTAFRAAKPTHRQSFLQHARLTPERPSLKHHKQPALSTHVETFARCYSDNAKKADVEEKVKDAEKRIERSLDARADILTKKDSTPKPQKDETIVHTLPEASSIVFTRETEPNSSTNSKSLPDESKPSIDSHAWNDKKYAAWASSRWQTSPLPSQIADLRSRATKRFTSFMDNFQSQIVVAAHHLNDLTGYTGIERLKKDIEAQEAAVQTARQHVKDSREKYSEAIAMRSTTQREVNDLLHRKHAWTPTDLERFTNLYRSDHANEQAELRTHQTLSEAEAQYEEASTRLAKSILARYHEEQIWSDKIRQMSTWGTWGLMGLNVLLFIVFQIAIEPWRRRRLVRGFEEKVQKALDEKERVTDEKLALMQARRDGDQVMQEAVQKQPEGLVATAAEEVAEAIVDAVSGATDDSDRANETPKAEDVENAAEQVTMRELEDENQAGTQSTSSTEAETIAAADAVDAEFNTGSSATSTQVENLVETLNPNPDSSEPPQNWQEQLTNTYQHAIKTTTEAYAHYSDAFTQQFDGKEHVVLSKRELTTRVLEGVATGVALTCGVMFVVLRGR